LQRQFLNGKALDAMDPSSRSLFSGVVDGFGGRGMGPLIFVAWTFGYCARGYAASLSIIFRLALDHQPDGFPSSRAFQAFEQEIDGLAH
jgi:hypothetical protein